MPWNCRAPDAEKLYCNLIDNLAMQEPSSQSKFNWRKLLEILLMLAALELLFLLFRKGAGYL